MKKRLKLKMWVKVTIAIIFMIILLVISGRSYNKAVDKCINNGGTSEMCVRGLR